MPVQHLFRPLPLAALAVLVLAATAWRFIAQTQQEQAMVAANIARMRTLSRAELAAMWHVREIRPFQFRKKFVDRLSWTPSTTATLALAVTPRVAWSEADAVYSLYDGDRPLVVFAVTSSGIYLNDQRLDLRRHPDTLLARPLTREELDNLSRLLDLLRLRRDGFDPQSPAYRWTHQVIQTARDLYQAQARLAGLPAAEN